ncbi:ricin-type beta-trefoil lectin domain protein [Kineosporia sp. NBRC 101731]|uniref:ricin-type beta-trefoil lectin domain protein n=1 Tax=Kineosporia sp. NBRC 101731 TaxID=3032199 RepID=UPI00255354EF|nr:ricin-type beta-trefoil lectin domain protein [Kineosporia sp. NBRC 101731]
MTRNTAGRRRLAVLAAGAVTAAAAVTTGYLTWPGTSSPAGTTAGADDTIVGRDDLTDRSDLLTSKKTAQKAGDPIPGSYLVRLADRPGLRTPRQIRKAADRLAGQVDGEVTYVYTAALHGFAVKTSDAKALAAAPEVASVSQDVVMAGLETQTQSPAPWHLDRIDQPDLPLSGSYDSDDDGSGANIFVLDTGVRTTHQEFGGRAVPDGPTPADSGDCAGHGTAVAGAAAGSTYGVAKKAKIHAIRVLGCGNTGPMTSGLQAIDWITKNAPRPTVVNLSWGTSAQDELDNAIRASIKAGITYVIAAGNSNADACNSSPGRVREAITVGASDQNDNRAGFSEYGECVDLFAPGTDVATSAWDSDTAVTSASGTSLASPIVAGAAAVYLSQHPSATPAQVSAALSACADADILGDPGTGSPNLLLNSRCGTAGLTLGNPGHQTSGIGQDVTLPAITTRGATGTVSFRATGLPAGITINAATGVLSGTVKASAQGGLVRISATDSAGTVATTFQWDLIVGIGYLTGLQGLCADSNSSGTTDGNSIQIWECNQKWMAATDGTISFYDRDNGKCLSARGGSSDAGKLIVIGTCDGGTDQIWKASAAGQLVNPATGECLTAPKADWGTQLTRAACTDAAGQQWKLPTGIPDSVTLTAPGDQVTIVGRAASLRVRATSTSTSTTFTYAATGLPKGLVINRTSGLITGTPDTHQATATVNVTATGSTGVTATKAFSWKVTDGLISGPSGWCADDYYGKTDAGNPIVVWRCDAQSNTQLWTVGDDGTLEVKGVCMTADGTKIVVGECATAASWTQKGTALVEKASGLCLTAPALDYEKQFSLATCDGGTLQQWKLPTTKDATPSPSPTVTPTAGPTASPTPDPTPTSTPTPTTPVPTASPVVSGSIPHPSGSWCVDNRSGAIGLWDCNQTPAQTFTVLKSGRLAQSDLCVTPTLSNTRVGMVACSDADTSQVWQQAADGTVLNPSSGLCLTATGFGYTSPFTLLKCSGSSEQLWALPTA